jgi:hypothetical protein
MATDDVRWSELGVPFRVQKKARVPVADELAEEGGNR